MGRYIQGPAKGKAKMLVDSCGAKIVTASVAKTALSEGKGVVCVVDNGFFEAAAYAYSASEFEAFNCPDDYRPKTWLVMDKDKAETLAR